MIKIQIMPQDIPNIPSTKIQFNKSKSFFEQAKKFVIDQDDKIDQNNLVFYYSEKQRVIYEKDTVNSIIGNDDKPEIELYLFKNILNNLPNINKQNIQDINNQSTTRELDAIVKEYEENIKLLNKRCNKLMQESDAVIEERNDYREKYEKLEKSLRNYQNQEKNKTSDNNQTNVENPEIYRLKIELETQNNEYSNLQQQYQTNQIQLEKTRQQLISYKQDKEKLDQKYLNLQSENENIKKLKDQQDTKIKRLQGEIEDLQKSINQYKETLQQNEQVKKDFSTTKQKLDNQIIENKTKDLMIQERNKKISQLEEKEKNLDSEIKNQKKEFQEYQQHNQELKKNSEILKQKLDQQNNRFEFLKYFRENNPFKQLNDNIITPIDQMFQAKTNPYEFTEQKNVNTNSCDSQVIALTIKSKEGMLKWLQFKSNATFDTFLQKEPAKTWKILKSINNVGQGSKSKCFLMQVQSENERVQTFQSQVFALKMIEGHEEIKIEKYALFLSFQIFVAQVLAENFQEQIKKLLPKFKFRFQFPQIFMIGDNFYIGQRLLNRSYVSFQQNLNESEIKLINAFSQFTYQFTQGALIVTNMKGGQMNGNEIVFYEPIIYTPEGIFSPEDYGQTAFDFVHLSLNKEKPHLNGQEFLKNLNYDF
ncbi:unnamed protein product [Paramecium sonneborni]|uniref:Uncharacterized protein n=1 Tax=Paramecium sonneborni TaxID=65129 RepID=A0A8S1MR30_9CILI|nr:unnamed protein product [Paramecium sonneborni]